MSSLFRCSRSTYHDLRGKFRLLRICGISGGRTIQVWCWYLLSFLRCRKKEKRAFRLPKTGRGLTAISVVLTCVLAAERAITGWCLTFLKVPTDQVWCSHPSFLCACVCPRRVTRARPTRSGQCSRNRPTSRPPNRRGAASPSSPAEGATTPGNRWVKGME